jgi:hypothetical protein
VPEQATIAVLVVTAGSLDDPKIPYRPDSISRLTGPDDKAA